MITAHGVSRSDIIVVGAGAAGLSAALVLGRARRRVIVCDDGLPRNRVAREMHGIISRDGMPPAEFLTIARAELQRYPSVRIVPSRLANLDRCDGAFSADLANGEKHLSRRLLLATGMKDVLPDIENLADFWGRSVFVCPYCDGWELRDRRIAISGPSEAVIELAQEVYQWSQDLVVCGIPKHLPDKHRAWIEATGVEVATATIRKAVGRDGQLGYLELDDGTRFECAALFLSVPLRQHSQIAQRLGCNINAEDRITIDEENRTSVPGCYAAGDATTKLHQVVIAAASGARAAIAINNDLVREDTQFRITGVSL